MGDVRKGIILSDKGGIPNTKFPQKHRHTLEQGGSQV